MTIHTRGALDAIASYRPGRAPRQLSPGPEKPAIHLASNESAFDPLPVVAASMRESARSVNRYPDFYATSLREVIADRYRLEPAQITVGCGSVALCRNVVEATVDRDDTVVVPVPSFEVYRSAAAIAGGRPIAVPVRNYKLDVDAMCAAVADDTRVVFVCNPNNPTSTALTRAELTAFLDAIPRRVLIVLDEAYGDFVTDPGVPDGVTLLERWPNLVVLRTFSKAYGLAGLRVGYAASSLEFADVLRKVALPFGVSSVGLAAAVASMGKTADKELRSRLGQVTRERSRVTDALAKMGIPVAPSQTNFLWLPIGARAQDFVRYCETRGVLIRAVEREGARVTVGLRPENDAFLAAASDWS